MLQTNDDDGIDRFIEPNEEDYEIALKEIKKAIKNLIGYGIFILN